MKGNWSTQMLNEAIKQLQHDPTFSRTKDTVGEMLDESSNQFKFVATRFQQASDVF